MKIGLDMIVERMNACNENNVSLIWSLENMIKVMLGFFENGFSFMDAF